MKKLLLVLSTLLFFTNYLLKAQCDNCDCYPKDANDLAVLSQITSQGGEYTVGWTCDNVQKTHRIEDLGVKHMTGSLNLSGCTELRTAVIYWESKITSLIVNGCTKLEQLDCTSNQLTSLDVRGCSSLEDLKCWHNQLTSLNASGCLSLRELDCSNNQLKYFNVSGCSLLRRLDCSDNQLTDLNLSGCSSLGRLWCDNNQLASLNLSDCSSLSELDCRINQLTSLDVSNCTALKTLECPANQLTTLDVSYCTALNELGCQNNQLKNLNVSGLNSLRRLECGANQLTNLNVSACTALERLECGANQLTTLDVSGLISLNQVSFNDNPLKSLNVAGCSSLGNLDPISYGQLEALNCSGCVNFSDLDCANNKLTYLNLNGCSSLNSLRCANNRLKDIGLSGCTSLREISCTCNQLSDQSLPSFYGLNLGCVGQTYLDLRKNTGFTQEAIQALDENLSCLSYEQIYWNEYSVFNPELEWIDENMAGTPVGVVADSCSSLKINITRVTGNAPVNVIDAKITDLNGNTNVPLGRIGSSVSDATSSEFTLNNPVGDEWNLVYVAPDEFSYDNNNFEQEREVKVEIKINCSYIYYVTIKIIRPPVLLIHGLRDNYQCFAELQSELVYSNRYTNIQAFRADYSATNQNAFEDNIHVVPDYIQIIKKIWNKQGFAVSKVDIVGHSMGGILSRLYLQGNLYKNDIHKLITVNTPHSGAESANIIVSLPIIRYSGIFIGPIDFSGKANEDLQVNSYAIRQLLNGNSLNRNIVPSYSIETNIYGYYLESIIKKDFNATAMYILYMIYYQLYYDLLLPMDNLPDLVFNGNNDLVVAGKSQIGGLSANTLIDDAWHSASPNNTTLKSKIAELLELPSSSNEFSTNGFHPEQIDWLGFKKTELKSSTNNHDSIYFVHPDNEITLNAGEQINIEAQCTKGIKTLFFLVHESSDSVYFKDSNDTILAFNYKIPTSALGKIPMYVFGADTLGNLFIDSTFINISSNAIPQSISVSWPTDSLILWENVKGGVHVSCLFSDGISRDITSFPNVQYSTKTGNALCISQGVLKGIQAGQDTLTILYAGLSCKLPVVILEKEYTYIAVTTFPDNSGNITGAGAFNKGENVSLTAIAETGYTFVNWTEKGTQVSTDASYSFTAANDRELVANFITNTYSVEAEAYPLNAGTITGTGTYGHGNHVSLTATAATGYTFTNWTESGNIVSTDAKYSFTATQNRNLVANFQSSTGVNDFSVNNTLAVYPNPNNGRFTLEIDNEYRGEVLVKIYYSSAYLSGSVKLNKATNRMKQEFQIKNTAKGVYLIEVQMGINKIVKAVIVD